MIQEEIVPRVLSDSVQYQDGGVVSRTLVNKNSGTLTLFAFDREESLSEHSAPFDALVFLIEGEMDITISGKISRLSGGDYIIMPADKPHALKAIQRSKMMLVMLKS